MVVDGEFRRNRKVYHKFNVGIAEVAMITGSRSRNGGRSLQSRGNMVAIIAGNTIYVAIGTKIALPRSNA